MLPYYILGFSGGSGTFRGILEFDTCYNRRGLLRLILVIIKLTPDILGLITPNRYKLEFRTRVLFWYWYWFWFWFRLVRSLLSYTAGCAILRGGPHGSGLIYRGFCVDCKGHTIWGQRCSEMEKDFQANNANRCRASGTFCEANGKFDVQEDSKSD